MKCALHFKVIFNISGHQIKISLLNLAKSILIILKLSEVDVMRI